MSVVDQFEDRFAVPTSSAVEAKAYHSLLALRSSSGARYFADKALQFPKKSAESRALEMFERSFRAIRVAADECIDDGRDPADQIEELGRRIAELGELEEVFDTTMSRMGQFHVPLYLRAIVDREVGRVEHLHRTPVPPALDSLEAVRHLLDAVGKKSMNKKRHKKPRLHNLISAGPPRRFEIHIADLSERLKLQGAGPAVSVLTLPTLEGIKSPLWAPIVAGHEIAHLAFRQMAKFHYLYYLAESLRELLPADLEKYAEHKGRFGVWLEELLCDLNAVRVYGPAGYSAIAEMLFVLQSTDDTLLGASTHPPTWQRLRLMRSALERTIDTDSEEWRTHVAPLVDPFRSLEQRPLSDIAEASTAELERRRFDERNDDVRREVEGELVSRALSAAQTAMIDEMFGSNGFFQGHYDLNARSSALHHVADELAADRPVEPLYLDGSDSSEEDGQLRLLAHADLINAMWREHLSEDPQHPARERVQNIILHSCDAREFVRFWPKEDRRGHAPTKDRFEIPYGRLSGLSIKRAIDDGVMVFSPLIGDQIKEAGIDLRLGTKFITKWKASVDTIDLIGPPNQVLMMENFVEVPWAQKFVLHPGEFVLASTLEYIILPKDVAATVDSRSGFGRLGIQVAEALSVQPFTDNCITLELSNVGDVPLALVPGQAIAQFALTRFRFAEERPNQFGGNYSWDIGPASSRFYTDRDRKPLKKMRRATRTLT